MNFPLNIQLTSALHTLGPDAYFQQGYFCYLIQSILLIGFQFLILLHPVSRVHIFLRVCSISSKISNTKQSFHPTELEIGVDGGKKWVMIQMSQTFTLFIELLQTFLHNIRPSFLHAFRVFLRDFECLQVFDKFRQLYILH